MLYRLYSTCIWLRLGKHDATPSSHCPGECFEPLTSNLWPNNATGKIPMIRTYFLFYCSFIFSYRWCFWILLLSYIFFFIVAATYPPHKGSHESLTQLALSIRFCFQGAGRCLSRTDGKRVVGVGNGSGTQGTKYIHNWSHTFCRNLTLIYCTNHVSSQIGGLDALDISSSGFSKAEEIVFCPWISWAMRRWPWISYLLAVFCLQGCSSNDKPSKESSCFLTRGGVGLAYKKDCSSSKLVETDLPYPVRWKILQDENLGDFNVWMFQGLSFFSPRRGLHFSFCLTMNL